MNLITLFLIPSILFFINLLLLSPFKNKLLYKDDGNWFYQAIFYKQGIRHYNFFEGQLYIPIIGIYTLPDISLFFYRLFGKNKYTFFNKLKMVLMSLMSVSLYFTIYFVTRNSIIAIIGNTLFNILYFLPKRAFYVTYAENYQVMPVLFAFAIFKIAIVFNCPEMLILSGMIITFSLNWKITGLLHLAFFPFIFIYENFPALFLYYFIGLFVMNFVLPLFILGFKRYGIYVLIFIRALLQYPGYFLPKSLFKKINNFMGKHINTKFKVSETIKKDYLENPPSSEAGYVDQRQARKIYNFTDKIKQLREFINDYYLMFLVAIPTLIFGIITLNKDFVGLFLLLISSLVMWYVQGGRTNNYLNLILPFLYLFFIFGLYILISSGIFSIIFASVILSFWIIKHWQSFYYEMKNMNHNIPTFPRKHTLYAETAVKIGEYIKSKTKSNERIFVWGNMPVVYLFAERLCSDFKFLFTYPVGLGIIHHHIKVLLIHLRRNPPKYITFFQYIDVVDEWNMEKIEAEINVPYKMEKLYRIKDKNKEYHPIPLYIRDDEKYFDSLYEKFRISKNIEYLNKILHLDPENKLAEFWKTIYEEKISYEEAVRYLENFDFSNSQKTIMKIDLLKYFEKTDILFQYWENLNIDESNYRILQEKGEYYFSRGDVVNAFEMFNKAKDLNPYSAEIYNNLGVLSYSLEDFQSAVFYLQKAIEIFSEYEDAKNNLKSIKSQN